LAEASLNDIKTVRHSGERNYRKAVQSDNITEKYPVPANESRKSAIFKRREA
jgi:hypothetical protein